MRCPKCGCLDDKVIDSRAVKDGAGVRRRRECLSCAYRYTTIEGIMPEELKVVKRNAVREDFDRDKLRRGIANACYKRPVSPDEIAATSEKQLWNRNPGRGRSAWRYDHGGVKQSYRRRIF